MKGWAAHLLFHLLAISCGAATGSAGVLWWSRGSATAMWAAVAALALGVLVLVLQWSYIDAAQPRAARPGTRSDLPYAAPDRDRVGPPTRRF